MSLFWALYVLFAEKFGVLDSGTCDAICQSRIPLYVFTQVIIVVCRCRMGDVASLRVATPPGMNYRAKGRQSCGSIVLTALGDGVWGQGFCPCLISTTFTDIYDSITNACPFRSCSRILQALDNQDPCLTCDEIVFQAWELYEEVPSIFAWRFQSLRWSASDITGEREYTYLL